MAQKFKKNPVTVEAVLYDGTNIGEVIEFVDGDLSDNGKNLLIERKHPARPGDYIVKDPSNRKSLFCVVAPGEFLQTHTPPKENSTESCASGGRVGSVEAKDLTDEDIEILKERSMRIERDRELQREKAERMQRDKKNRWRST